MRHRLAILCGWLLTAAAAWSQDAPARRPVPAELPPIVTPPAAPIPAPASVPAPEAVPLAGEPTFPAEIVWFRTDWLMWQLPGSRFSFPIVTTGDPNDGPLAGAIDQPRTRTLLGNDGFDNNNTGGLRFILGAWLDSPHDYGVEVVGLTVFRENHGFQASSDGSGNPPLYLPAFNTQIGREDSAIIADPLQQFGGTVDVGLDMRFWTVELNGLFNVRRSDRFEWTMLSGVRYLDFRETFTLSAVSNDLILNQFITLDDKFQTSNQFIAYQAGSRMRLRVKNCILDLTGKIAVGGNLRKVQIAGSSSSGGPDATDPGRFPGGFYAQPSNIGRESDLAIAVMPALEARLAYQFTSGIVASVGYDLMCLSQAVRVAHQIDRNLNLSQSRVLGTPTPAAPLMTRKEIDSSDVFVHGLSVGLEIRY